MVCGSVPTENLPTKSHDTQKHERRTLVRSDATVQQAVSSSTCTSSRGQSEQPNFESFVKQAKKENLDPWKLDSSRENEVKFELFDNLHCLPKYTLVVNSTMEFSVFVYNWPLPENHGVYKERKRSVKYSSICELLHIIEGSLLCNGLSDEDEVRSVVVDPTSQCSSLGSRTVLRHSIPKVITNEQLNFEVSVLFRSVDCELIRSAKQEQCKPCSTAESDIKKASRRKSRSSQLPAKPKASLASCGAEKLRATVKATRLECKELEKRLQNLEKSIEKDGLGVSESTEKDILKIMAGQNLEATPHMKFFWEQQMKLLQSSKMGRRYHPQVIRFALSVHAKSASAYRELRESGALILPSERVLRDYKNYFKPKAGVNKENVENLRDKISSFSNVQRYVALVMDEMKIQSKLVFDKISGELIGFIDLGDPMTNYANLDQEDTIASHALAFLVRGLCTDLKHVIAYYFTGNVTSFQLMPIFWRIVSVLEVSLNLWVVAAVNDGASPNRKFFRLHCNLTGDPKHDLVYKTCNVFAESRFIYFFADSPHLMKTARNCLYNSGSGSCSRYMWNNGKYLLFRHIANLFYSDQEFALHSLPKLTLDHIMLTSYSKMKVKLATQVLSKSVAIALEESGNEEVLGTAMFCQMMNDFFDCTNVRSTTEHSRKRNHFIKPYTSCDDERFSWLKNVFLKYLEDWREITLTRPGEYSSDDRGKMFLSLQTYEGLRISVYSHVEAIQFLLKEGFQYVLTERFMQDVVEDYFGHQRARGGRSDNPTAQQFGYNDLTIASQRDIAPVIRGNVGGRYEVQKWHTVSNEPVKKRAKKK